MSVNLTQVATEGLLQLCLLFAVINPKYNTIIEK